MKKRKQILTAIGALWMLGYAVMLTCCAGFRGAVTTPVLSRAHDLADPMREFVQDDTPMHKNEPHAGAYIGIVSRRGASWKKYHFPGVLVPTNRVLEILVEDEPSGRVIVREVAQMGEKKEDAFLVDHCFCGDCVPTMQHEAHTLYTNALGSDDFICSPPKRLHGNFYSDGFVTADVSLRWNQRSRTSHCLTLCRLLYSVPVDILILPAQPYFYVLYQL